MFLSRIHIHMCHTRTYVLIEFFLVLMHALLVPRRLFLHWKAVFTWKTHLSISILLLRLQLLCYHKKSWICFNIFDILITLVTLCNSWHISSVNSTVTVRNVLYVWRRQDCKLNLKNRQTTVSLLLFSLFMPLCFD